MPDPIPETETQQIRNAESAKVQGFIKGLLTGIILNWKEIAIIVGLCVGLYNHFKEQSDAKWIGQHLDEKQQQIDQLKTNQPSKTP
jgi:uncharacterized metal-binding protein